MAAPSQTGISKGGLGNLLANLPEEDLQTAFAPAEVAQPATMEQQLSDFYGPDPQKISQPYMDYYRSFALPGDESAEMAKQAEEAKPKKKFFGLSGQGRFNPNLLMMEEGLMNFANPTVGTVEMPILDEMQQRRPFGGGRRIARRSRRR